MGLIFHRNDVLNANPPVGDQHLTEHGSDWLWAVFCCYAAVFLLVTAWTRFARQGEKMFHYLFTISLFVGTVCYFAMASDLGSTPIMPSNNLSKHPGSRQIFFAKYINWFASWPPIFVAVGLISGVSWATIIYNVFLQLIYVTLFLVSAMTESKYKWGFFTFGLWAWVLLTYSVVVTPRESVKRLEVQRHYFLTSSTISFLLLLYPIAIGISDDGNKISTTRGFIWFGILDFLMGPAFALGFLACSHSCDYRKFNIYFTQYGRVATETEVAQREKVPPQEAVASSAV
jgi:bacteriorhodopsin